MPLPIVLFSDFFQYPKIVHISEFGDQPRFHAFADGTRRLGTMRTILKLTQV
jgi:hypothetical protein